MHIVNLSSQNIHRNILVSSFLFHVENKSKRDLIQLLVQRGYESDPVKAWKEAQEKVIHVVNGMFLTDFLPLQNFCKI